MLSATVTCERCGVPRGDGGFCDNCRVLNTNPAAGVYAAAGTRRLTARLLDIILFAATAGVGWWIWLSLTAAQGQSPAKRLLGLRVVGADATPLSGGAVWFREGVLALLFTPLLPLNMLWGAALRQSPDPAGCARGQRRRQRPSPTHPGPRARPCTGRIPAHRRSQPPRGIAPAHARRCASPTGAASGPLRRPRPLASALDQWIDLHPSRERAPAPDVAPPRPLRLQHPLPLGATGPRPAQVAVANGEPARTRRATPGRQAPGRQTHVARRRAPVATRSRIAAASRSARTRARIGPARPGHAHAPAPIRPPQRRSDQLLLARAHSHAKDRRTGTALPRR